MKPELLIFPEDRGPLTLDALCERQFRSFSVGVAVVSLEVERRRLDTPGELEVDWWRLGIPGELYVVLIVSCKG